LGGAIFNNQGATLTITNSTFTGNTAAGGGGGSGANAGGNGQGLGGAVFNYAGNVTIVNSTLASNIVSGSGTNNGGAVFNLSNAAGQTATLSLFNTIVANSIGGNSDVQNDQVAGNAVVNADGFDLTTTATGIGGNGTVGVIGKTTTNALNLGPLTLNLGPTATMKPGNGGFNPPGPGLSSAIGAGSVAEALSFGLGADQEGVARYIFNGLPPGPVAIDVGAVEVGGGVLPASLVVSTTVDSFTGLTSFGQLSLREAVYLANSGIGGGVVTFDPSMAGQTFTLSTTGTTAFGPTALAISGAVSIQGLTGNSGITISGGGTQRIFGVFAGANLTLQFLTLSGGMAVGGHGGKSIQGGGGGGGGLGGAIFNNGAVTILNSTLSGNTAHGGSGGSGGPVGGGTGGGGGGAAGGTGGYDPGFNYGGGGGGVAGAGGNSFGAGGGLGGANEAGVMASSAGNGTLGGGGGGGSTGVRAGGSGAGLSSAGFGGGGGGGGKTAGVAGPGGAAGFDGGGGGGSSNNFVGYAGGVAGFGGGGGGGGGAGGGGAGGAPGFGAGMGGNGSSTVTVGGGGGGGAGLGGAIFNNQGASLTITNSTFSGNTAQGSSGGSGSLGATNGGAGDGYGGAVFNRDGTVTITNSTLAGNTVSGPGTNGGGAVFTVCDSASQTATVTIVNSILSGSVGGVDIVVNRLAGAGASSLIGTAPNIIQTLTVFVGTTNNNSGSIHANPMLQAVLTNNGGPTLTLAPLFGSPALGAGNTSDAAGLSFDQRGPRLPTHRQRHCRSRCCRSLRADDH
jgi:hypothetical protein